MVRMRRYLCYIFTGYKKRKIFVGIDIAIYCFNGNTRSFFNDLNDKLPTFIKNSLDEYGTLEYGCPIVLWDFDQNPGERKNSK